MKRLLLLPALLLIFPTAAPAAVEMPAPSDNEIVVPTSIAGVKTGMTIGAALKAWGAVGKECSNGGVKFSTCQWGDPYGSTGTASFASGASGKVDAISIYSRSTTDGTTFPYTGSAVAALKNIKTEEKKGPGFGLGSLLTAVIKAYPGGTKSGGGKTPHITYRLKNKRGGEMFFVAATKTKKIGQITLNSTSAGG